MRTALTALFFLASGVPAVADVGYVEVNQSNQAERAGDWFRIGIKAYEGMLSRVDVFIKKRTNEVFQGAEVQLKDGQRAIVVVPTNVKTAKNDAGYYFDFLIAPEQLKNCHLTLSVEHRLKDGLSVGTAYDVDVGSYAK